MHGIMECPWKEPAAVEETEGGFRVVTMQFGAIRCFYKETWMNCGRLMYEFHEDEADAHLFPDRESAARTALGANDMDADILCRLIRPRMVKELMELREAAEKGQDNVQGTD